VTNGLFTRHIFTFTGLTEDELYETLNLLENVKEWREKHLHDSTCYFEKDKIEQKIARANFVCMCREMKTFLSEDLQTG